jgi:hypothetical protein
MPINLKQRSGHTQNAYDVAAIVVEDEASLMPKLLGCGCGGRRGGKEAERPEWWLVRMENGSARP